MTRVQQEEEIVMTPRKAFGLLCKIIYKRFGKETLPIIEQVCYNLGLADGIRMRNGSSGLSFREAHEKFIENVRRKGFDPELIEFTETKRHSKFCGPCILGLENTSKDLCEAAMAIDRGMFKAAMGGRKSNLSILKSLAAGDPCCEVVWTSEDI